MEKVFTYLGVLICILFIQVTNLTNATAQVVINEYSCSNFESFPDNYQEYGDWIELYNTGSTSVDLSGYFLSDKPEAPANWQIPAGVSIPAHGFRLFWASGRDEAMNFNFHTNFKLTQTKATTEYIVFADPSGVILDQQALSITQKGHSNGRITNGSETWGVYTSPTPGTSNTGHEPYARYTEKPAVNIPGGFYQENLSVIISTNEPNATIRYTLNGNEPLITSTVYTAPISIDATKIIKARVFSNDPTILPGLIEFDTYFINESFSVPVVSIAANDLTTLLNGDEGKFPWGSFEYYNASQLLTTKGYGEFDKHGQDSWVHPQRSLDYKTRDECGYNYAILEKLFADSDREEFQKIILRASGDDNYPGIDSSAHIRDDFIQTISVKAGMSLDERKSARCVVFANGQFWGVYAIREKPNDHDFTKYYYDQDKYNINYLMLWGGTWAEYGGQAAFDDWNALYSFAMSNNLAAPENYEYVISQFDPTSIVDYMLINSFVVCSDWLNWNVGWWRGLNPQGGHRRWGYILWDEDATIGHYYNYTGIPAQTPFVSPCFQENLHGGSDPEGHVALLNKLRTNPGFEQYYVSRYADLLNSSLNLNNLLPLFDSLVGVIAPEMPRHFQRWGGSNLQWNANTQKIRNFLSQRFLYVREALTECYNLTGPYPLVADVEPPLAGQVQLNSLELKSFPWSGMYYGNMDTKISAIESDLRFKFDHWELNHHTVFPTDSALNITLRLNAGDTILAVFVPRIFSDSLVINEINYNSSPGFDPGDWVEFYNPHGYDLDISGWSFKDEDDLHIFTFAQGTVIEPFEFLVLANDVNAFHAIFPDVINYTGPMGFGLSGSGELIRIFDEENTLIDTVYYDDNLPWPLEPDGNGPTLELINPGWDNALAESWKSSGEPHGTPGEANSPNVGIAFYQGNNLNTMVYPNPFSNSTTLIIKSNLKVEGGRLSIYNLTGQEVLNYTNIATNRYTISARGLKAGTYFYRFVSNSGSLNGSGKLLIK